jgi:hypothetical protein
MVARAVALAVVAGVVVVVAVVMVPVALSAVCEVVGLVSVAAVSQVEPAAVVAPVLVPVAVVVVVVVPVVVAVAILVVVALPPSSSSLDADADSSSVLLEFFEVDTASIVLVAFPDVFAGVEGKGKTGEVEDKKDVVAVAFVSVVVVGATKGVVALFAESVDTLADSVDNVLFGTTVFVVVVFSSSTSVALVAERVVSVPTDPICLTAGVLVLVSSHDEPLTTVGLVVLVVLVLVLLLLLVLLVLVLVLLVVMGMVAAVVLVVVAVVA